MSKARDYLPELLDKTRAVIESGAGRPVDLARFVMPDAPLATAKIQVNYWLKGKRQPNGESALRIQAWLAVKTLEISASSEAMRAGYVTAFKKTGSGKKQFSRRRENAK